MQPAKVNVLPPAWREQLRHPMLLLYTKITDIGVLWGESPKQSKA